MFEDRSQKKQRTEISSLGEFGLIRELTKNLSIKNNKNILGSGDDAAIANYSDEQTLVSTEIFTEKVHFDLSYTPLKHLGYKLVVAGVSDIYAMNGTPSQVLIGLGLSNRFSLEAVQELYEGIEAACTHYQIDLTGGDVTSSAVGLVISITALGHAKEDNIVRRNGAQENDLILTTGDLGAAYLGLLLLEREKKVFEANPEMQPELNKFDYLLKRQLKPDIHFALLNELREKGVKPTSMIDISDGLASDIMHITHASKKGCRIYEEKIPIDAESIQLSEEFNLNPVTVALNGGEDYELLFTVKAIDYEKIKTITGIQVIGHITSEGSGDHLVTTDERLIELSAPGWIKAYENNNGEEHK